jgi:DNA-binding CsgD family transcriptional regulator
VTEPTDHRLPGPLRLVRSLPFVGRARELTALRMLVPRVEGESSRAVLIGGEAGSGKSRLVRELAREVAADGALVLYGACDAAVRTPYRPFGEALGWLLRDLDADALHAVLGVQAGEIARLLPELRERGAFPAGPAGSDPDTARHRLHTAVSELLATASRRQSLVLVLEDCHWADAPTLLLLRHLARAPLDARMLIVATFRDAEADLPATLADALADLRRSEEVVRLRMTGLSEDEIADFVRAAAGSADGAPELAQAIVELTEGNPFLLCELWRMLVECGDVVVADGRVRVVRPIDELATPESVREVVAQRLVRLDPVTRDTLELAAAAGTQFELDVIGLAGSADRSEQVRALDAAERSGLIEQVPGGRLAYRFTHELVRRTVVGALTSLRRAELHLRIGEALELAHASPDDRVLADLAHHFLRAVPLGDPARAVAYNLEAADAASAALDFDEAVARLQAVLDIGIADERRRAGILIELGTAQHRAGSLGSLESFLAAAGIARGLGDGCLLAEAAIGYENACWRPGVVEAGARELLEEAYAALPARDSEQRVGVLAGLARAADFQGDHAGGDAARGEAIALARRLGDRYGLATVLARSYWARRALGVDAVRDMLSESQAIAEEVGDIELQAEVAQWRIATLIGLGDLATARRELTAVLAVAERTAQPFIAHVAQLYAATIALCDGRLADSEAAALLSYESGRLLTGRDASGGYGIQMFGVRREQGRLAELAPVVRILAASSGGDAWRPARAVLFAELGMEQDARRELEIVAAGGLEPLRESLWLASLTYLADAAAALGDGEIARLVYRSLSPYEGTIVMVGVGATCYGAADRFLGKLAATLGDAAEADRHLTAAMEMNRRMGASTWVAHTALEHARVLLAGGSAGAAATASALLRDARAIATRIGMPTLLARIDALESPRRAAAAFPDGLSAREVEILVLVARGLSNREIGAELVISEHTAANHVRSILRKTGSANRTEAASYAHVQGLAARSR